MIPPKEIFMRKLSIGGYKANSIPGGAVLAYTKQLGRHGRPAKNVGALIPQGRAQLMSKGIVEQILIAEDSEDYPLCGNP
jgi:hypothetical protein